ncbi:MAG: hypothetical protein ABF608_00645 [Sporolactobacillus sp.]
MISSEQFSSIDVAGKMNEWYLAIQDYDLPRAHQLKAAVDEQLAHMEQNQNVLLYYSLLEFRMQLNEEKPLNHEKMEAALNEIENGDSELTGMLDYYFWLFKGMYELKQQQFTAALASYRKAEERVERLGDMIEAAHCYYHLAEVYFSLNYSLISIRYSRKALAIFANNPDYYHYRFLSKSLIGSNFLKTEHLQEAQHVYEEAYRIAEAFHNQYLIAIARFNCGLIAMKDGQYDQAYKWFAESVAIFREKQSHHLPKALCSCLEVRVLQNRKKEAAQIYQDVQRISKQWENEEYLAKSTIIYELLPDRRDAANFRKAFRKLISLHLDTWIEEYALAVARALVENEHYQEAVYYFEQNQQAAKNRLHES